MKQNILHLDVKPDLLEEPVEACAGVMFEHNATALCFHLDPAYQSPDYKYYLEFVTVHGVMRTDFLEPNLQNEIVFSIPQEVTGQITALAVLNIMASDANGKASQLIKSKTVRLYFSNLENTDKILCENYAFSVNQLLEAIKNGTFKGAQGEPGPMGADYTLLPTDKQEIADLLNKEHFGLPLFLKERGMGNFKLPKITEISSMRSLCVSPTTLENALQFVKVVLGENALRNVLIPEAYDILQSQDGKSSSLEVGTFYDSEYTLSTLKKKISNMTSFFQYKNHRWKISAKDAQDASDLIVDQDFRIDSRDSCYIHSGLIDSREKFDSALKEDWDGLSLTEKGKSVILRQEFPEPLHFLDETYKDSFDFFSGKILKRTATLIVTPDMIPDAPDSTATYGAEVVYSYNIKFPAGAPRKRIVPKIGYCNAFPVIPSWLRKDSDLAGAIERGEPIEGVCVATRAPFVTLHSKKSAAEIKAIIEEFSKTHPMLIVYPTSAREEVLTSPATVSLPQGIEDIYVSPHTIAAEVEYAADISEKTNELESRIAALENRMDGENL